MAGGVALLLLLLLLLWHAAGAPIDFRSVVRHGDGGCAGVLLGPDGAAAATAAGGTKRSIGAGMAQGDGDECKCAPCGWWWPQRWRSEPGTDT